MKNLFFQALTKKLLEILGTTFLDVQKEIIACLPDIVEDSDHGTVALKLRSDLFLNTHYTVTVHCGSPIIKYYLFN